jgi:hypothetical protein
MERSSTDKRIDDLSGRADRFEENVDRRFDQVDRRFERLEDKIDARFDKVDARFDRNDDRFLTKEEFRKASEVTAVRLDRIDDRLDRWGKVMTGGMAAIAASVVAKVLGF